MWPAATGNLDKRKKNILVHRKCGASNRVVSFRLCSAHSGVLSTYCLGLSLPCPAEPLSQAKGKKEIDFISLSQVWNTTVKCVKEYCKPTSPTWFQSNMPYWKDPSWKKIGACVSVGGMGGVKTLAPLVACYSGRSQAALTAQEGTGQPLRTGRCGQQSNFPTPDSCAVLTQGFVSSFTREICPLCTYTHSMLWHLDLMTFSPLLPLSTRLADSSRATRKSTPLRWEKSLSVISRKDFKLILRNAYRKAFGVKISNLKIGIFCLNYRGN